MNIKEGILYRGVGIFNLFKQNEKSSFKRLPGSWYIESPHRGISSIALSPNKTKWQRQNFPTGTHSKKNLLYVKVFIWMLYGRHVEISISILPICNVPYTKPAVDIFNVKANIWNLIFSICNKVCGG